MGKRHLEKYHSKCHLEKYHSNESNINACLRCLVNNQDEIIQAQREMIASMKLEKARLLKIREFAQQELTRLLEIKEYR